MSVERSNYHIGSTSSIANAFQNCLLIAFIHIIANISTLAALDLQVAIHRRTELESILCWWLPCFDFAYLEQAFIGTKHGVNGSQLLKLLIRQHI